MMDHIINFDWNHREPEQYFIKPEDLDNSVTERILRNKFRDPLISSDEEAEDNKPLTKIDWDKVFSDSEKFEKRQRMYVPGLVNSHLRYLKLSAMTGKQHNQSLKVICARYPHMQPFGFVARPNKQDLEVFEEIKEIYEKEQQEFIEWAKVMWSSDHCRRALRPKPRVESVYEAHFKMKAAEIQCFPKTLRVAAQIAFETTDQDDFEMVHLKDLITVNIDELPEVECPMKITEKISILKPSSIPEPCPVHTCKFVLPTEKSVSTQPLTEVHRSLAQLAGEESAGCVAAEGALRCLLDLDRPWTLPVSVVDTFGADGEPCNVLVLGSEFSVAKQPAPARTHRAFTHMLGGALVADTEMSKLRYSDVDALRGVKRDAGGPPGPTPGAAGGTDESSDEDEDMMVIVAGDDTQTSSPKAKRRKESPKPTVDESVEDADIAKKSLEGCTCKGTLFEFPPPRSYRKWRLRERASGDSVDVIVHCAHKYKAKGRSSELLLEPVVEYQPELGASRQPAGRGRSLALALRLRTDATLANVRVDGVSGEVVTFECHSAAQWAERCGCGGPRCVAALLRALRQLRHLLPGRYVLRHEPSHGANALLYASGGAGGGAGAKEGEVLSLRAEAARPPAAEEARSVAQPPALCDVLLPMHRHRRMLPLAFTYYPNMVAPEPRRPVTRQRPPPQALQLDASESGGPGGRKWPKKKGKKRKARQC